MIFEYLVIFAVKFFDGGFFERYHSYAPPIRLSREDRDKVKRSSMPTSLHAFVKGCCVKPPWWQVNSSPLSERILPGMSRKKTVSSSKNPDGYNGFLLFFKAVHRIFWERLSTLPSALAIK